MSAIVVSKRSTTPFITTSTQTFPSRIVVVRLTQSSDGPP